ncbi:MAG: C10 family peptidase, partial [Alloprevotella sp.]
MQEINNHTKQSWHPWRHAVTLCLALFCTALSVAALPVDEATARRRAVDFFQTQGKLKADGVKPAEVEVETCPAAYLCRHKERFVLLAADDDCPEVLGYGIAAASAPLPAPLAAMLRRPAATLSASLKGNYPPTGVEPWTPVAPLLSTVRHQSAPYNRYCPTYVSSSGNAYPTLVGCVATAMEQILTYHRAPVFLRDTLKGWETEHYTVPDLLPGTSVDTRLILDDYDDEANPASDEAIDAVARLSFMLGVACHMNWGPSSSGANTFRLVEPLRRAFGYGYVNYLDSYLYPPAAFWNYLASEIAARRPVYYAGSIMRGGGHAFVLDGLDAEGLFHVNWAYGGNYDGYFRLDVLAHPQPESDRSEEAVESGFFCNQECLTFFPDSLDVTPPDSLRRTGQEICVERVEFGAEPCTGCPTPVSLHLRNTTDSVLTTPFALIVNEPTDTAVFEQGDWVALTGGTLEGGETTVKTVFPTFATAGEKVLNVSADGETILFTLPFQVTEGGTTEMDHAAPELTFEAGGTVAIHQRFSNPSTEERAAQEYVFCVADSLGSPEVEITRHIFLAPSADTVVTVRFRDLVPGTGYQYLLRAYWPIVVSQGFVMPLSPDGISPVISDSKHAAQWYDLSGRPIATPRRPGVYLRREGG